MIRAAAASLVLVAVACGRPAATPSPPAQAAAPAPARLRGTLLAGADSTLLFVACGTTTERPVVAPPSSQLLLAVAAVNGGVRDSLFAEFTADTTGGVIRAVETLFATSLAEGTRCDRPREPFDVVAIGNEPFWRVTFDGTQLVLERPEPPREMVFDTDPAETRGTLTTIIGRRALGKVHELKLGLLRESCSDGMSDAWYPYRAEVRVGDLALHGCARR
ncbi:MAG: COG3650 family protein [Gemmatimonadaceae bacterium]